MLRTEAWIKAGKEKEGVSAGLGFVQGACLVCERATAVWLSNPRLSIAVLQVSGCVVIGYRPALAAFL